MDEFERAKNGDMDAFSSLFDLYKPVIFNMQKRYYIRLFDTEDWLQEGRIIFHKALLKYTPDRGATFGAYFKLMFDNHICSLLRKQNAYKRRVDCVTSSIEGTIEEQGIDVWNQLDSGQPSALDLLVLWEKLEKVETIFSKLEKDVISHYLCGETLEEIASALDTPAIRVQNALDRSRRKIVQYLFVE